MKEENSLYVNLYISSIVDTQLSNEETRLEIISDFPSAKRVSVMVESPGIKRKTLAFRIPSYAVDFKITDEDGIEIPWVLNKGYALVEGKFKKTKLSVAFEQPAVFVRANPRVRADAGKAAIMKGPQVYCLEEIDNGSNLSAIYVDTSQEIEEIFDHELMGGTLTLKLKGKKIASDGWKEKELYKIGETAWEDVSLKAVPYSSWGNRKPGEMIVWIKERF